MRKLTPEERAAKNAGRAQAVEAVAEVVAEAVAEPAPKKKAKKAEEPAEEPRGIGSDSFVMPAKKEAPAADAPEESAEK